MASADVALPPGPLVSCTGIVTADTVFGVERLPQEDGTISATTISATTISATTISATWCQETGGGVAANAAVAIARLGGRSRFVGCVGTDTRGLAARRGLLDEGVAVDGMHQIEHRSTPTSAVMVDELGRRMIVDHATNDFFDLADPSWAEDIGGADAVLVDLRWVSGAAASVAAAARAGVPSVVDVDRPTALATGLLTDATHLLFSAAALRTMSGIPRPGDALEHMARRTSAWVGVTLGEHGVLWLQGHSLCHRPAHPVVAVDTSGAGDTFHGAFALGLAEGRSEPAALDFAGRAAALTCTRRGGRSGMPRRSEVERFSTSLMSRPS